MRPATIRRLLVFGVCALGVTGLYLMPGAGGSPPRSSAPQDQRDPQPAAHPVSYLTQPTAAGSVATASPAGQPGATATTTVTTTPAAEPSPRGISRTDRRHRGVAAQNQEAGPDREAPSTITELSFPVMTPGRLTIRWPEATDNVRVAGYRVWLNGFRVADTAGLQVAVPWFNDGSRHQVVQVRAVDAAGNQSADAPAQLIERPQPEAGPTSTSSPTDTPVPEATASADPAPASNSSSGTEKTSLASADGDTVE